MATGGNLSGESVSNKTKGFEALMREAGPRVYTLSLRLTGNMADGQDLAAETFVRAYKSFASFRGDASFGTWTYRICLNLWKNRVRAEKRRSFWKHFSLSPRDDEDFPPLDPPAPDKPLDARLTDLERRRTVEEALGRLDPEERAVVWLRETEEKSYDEISDALGIAVGTVKSRLFRARERLRGFLAPGMEP
jgi:RNA polymerase sigma-70 factor, ECF subfamily